MEGAAAGVCVNSIKNSLSFFFLLLSQYGILDSCLVGIDFGCLDSMDFVS
jgi:hypothetical protein